SPNGGSRNSCPREHGSIAQNIFVLLNFPTLVVAALPQFNYALLNIRDDINDWKHGILSVPHSLNIPRFGPLKMDLLLDNIELQVCPMSVTAGDEFLCHSAQLLQRNSMVLHQHCDGAQTDNIFERIDSAVGIETILIGVARREKVLAVPAAQLPFGQPRKP